MRVVRYGLALGSSSLLLAAIALGLGVGARGAGAATPGYTIGVAPKVGDADLAGNGAYFAPKLSPGQTYSGQVLLANSNANPVTVRIYPVDGLTSPGSGGSTFSGLDQKLSGPGRWMTVTDPNRTLAPDSRSYADFSITVPAGTAPGDHLAGIAIEGVQPKAQSSGNIRITVLTRSVIGVEVVVPGPAVFNLKLGTPTLSKGTDGIGTITVPLTDTGGLLGQPVLTFQLENSSGYDKTVDRAISTVLPGDTVPISIYWPDQLKGVYDITVCARGAGMTSSVCAQGKGSLASKSQTVKTETGPFPSTPTSSFPILLVVVIAVLGGGALIAGGVFFGMRAARRRLLETVQAAVSASQNAGAPTGASEPSPAAEPPPDETT